MAATPAAQGAAQAAADAANSPQTPMVQAADSAPPSTQPVPPGAGVQELVAQSQGAPSGQGSGGGYVNPLPADAQIGRTDMGVDVDLKPGEPIVAIGRSRVLGVLPNWYEGQPYVALQLLDGPMQGHNYYVAEQITPAVSVGQIIEAGQPIAHYAASGSGIEIGWAGPNWEQTLAQATGHDNADMGDHANTPAGISFRHFLDSLSSGGGGGSQGAGGGSAAADQLVGQGVPPAAGGVTAAAVPGWSSSQNAVAAELFKTFTSAGLSPAGASAFIGNWMQESSLNPSEPGGFLAQWGGSRLSELTSEFGPNPSAAQQAQFALQELRGGYPSLLEQLKTTGDPRAAALAISDQYERPLAALANNANREAQAAAALAAFGTTQGSPQAPVAQAADVAQSPAGTGAAGPPAGAGAAGAAAAGAGAAGAASDIAAGGVGQAGGAAQTAGFKALEPHERAFHRHTVKFLATVQPSPDSPLYQQGGGGQAGQAAGGGQPGRAADVVAGQQPGQAAAGVAGQQQPGQAADLLQGQGAGAVPGVPGGGSITVNSSLLTPGQEKFAGRLAELTGLDPRVLSAWELAEESGSAAQGREAAGNFDWLNIGYTDSANFGTKDSIWSDPIKAAEATAGWIKGKDTIPGYGTASSGIQGILNTVGKSAREQMMAIANSGWASSHYGNGANLIATYDELSGIQITKS